MCMTRVCVSRARRARAVMVSVALIAGVAVSACASHHVLPRESLPKPAETGRPADESLSSFMARVRAVSSAARPRRHLAAGTLEEWDPRLSAALAEAALDPSSDRHRRVALEYRRLGVLDMAHAYFTKAARLDPTNAAAFDGLARIWRDWGFARLGFADAYRAVRFAPTWPVAANTLGTLFEAAGQIDDARVWYERALVLEPGAPYALNNLCYTAIMTSDANAVGACRRALAAAPDSRIVANNLGLAYAVEGGLDQARAQFDTCGDVAASSYNMGIVYMAKRQFANAIDAFDKAVRANPQFALAAERARQAHAAAGQEE